MNILPLTNLLNKCNIKSGYTRNSYLNLISSQIQNDTVCFTSSNPFKTEADAYKYCENAAKEACSCLKKNNSQEALCALGCRVEKKPHSRKLKIRGDYNNCFNVPVKRKRGPNTYLLSVPYDDFGIDTKKLVKDVEVITGNSDNLELFFNDILLKKTQNVQEALSLGEYENALNILGYMTSGDENGNITIKGDYSPILFSCGSNVKKLSHYGIDEKELLSHVVKISGDASFERDFVPEKYIQIMGNIYNNDNFACEFGVNPINKKLERKFLALNPEIQNGVQEINKMIEEGDSYSALKMLNYDCSKDDTAQAIINGDFDFSYNYDYENKLSLADMGVDIQNILKNVQRIKGDLIFDDSLNIDLSGIKVDGKVYPIDESHEASLFKNFMNSERIALNYSGLNKNIIKLYSQKNVLKPDLKTDNDFYFKKIEGKNKDFFDNLIAHRNKILTSDELKRKYKIGLESIASALEKGLLKPYGTEYSKGDDCSGFLYDISYKNNLKYLEAYRTKRKRIETITEKTKVYTEYTKRYDSYKDCRDLDLKYYPAKALERLGYGSKADLMDACVVLPNFYKIQKYIFDNDYYDITNRTMQDIIMSSERDNPSVIKLLSLRKEMGENEEDLKQAVISGKVDIISENPYKQSTRNDYRVDLFSPKNIKYFKTVDNKEFQEFLSKRQKCYEERKKRNDEYFKKFKKMKPLTMDEQERMTQERLAELAKEKRMRGSEEWYKQKKRLEEQKKEDFVCQEIAFILCPNSQETKRIIENPRISSVLSRNKQASIINNEFINGRIDYDEAIKRFSKLRLISDSDRTILINYYEKYWNGNEATNWFEAISNSRAIIEQYKKDGLDGIQDENIREKLIEWEEDNT